MPTIRNREALAIGGQNNNVVQGNQFEFLAQPSRVQVYARQDTATTGVGEVEIFLSNELIFTQSPVTVGAAGIRQNEDLLVDEVGDRGDRIVIRMVETGGAAIATLDWMVVLTPIAA